MAIIKRNISIVLLLVLLNLIVYKVFAKCQYKEYPHSYDREIPNPNVIIILLIYI